jgi:hypothetical protein
MADRPQTKAELIERLEGGYRAFEEWLSQLTDAQFSARHSSTDWSIKDHIAHLAAYEAGMAALLRRQPRWAAMGLDEKFVRDSESFDDINATLNLLDKDRTSAEVLVAFRDAHQQLMAALEKLTDAELLMSYAHYQPHDPDANQVDPVLGWIVGNTYEHYAEHQPWIEELLAQQAVS